MNIFDRLLGVLLPDDKTQPKTPVFETPLVVQSEHLKQAGPHWVGRYRVARQQADGRLVGAGPWRATQAEAERDLEALIGKDE